MNEVTKLKILILRASKDPEPRRALMKKLKISPIFFFKELMLCEINYKNILRSIKTQNFDVRGLKTAKKKASATKKKTFLPFKTVSIYSS